MSQEILDRLLAGLPHGPGFRFVDRLVEWVHRSGARGVWVVGGGEPFLAGHFPGRPIVPGVLIAEALAQVSGLVTAAIQPEQGGATISQDAVAGGDKARRLARVDVKFKREVRPPAEVVLESRLVREVGGLEDFEVRALVGGDVVAAGQVVLAGGYAGDS